MKKNNLDDSVGLHIIGGCGEAADRKIKAVFDSGLKIKIRSIADTYPESDFVDDNYHRNVIQKKSAKGLNPDVQDYLRGGVKSGDISYYDVGDGLPEKFFEGVGKNDMVVISTPNKYHLPYILQVLPKGCNILIEKPLAISPDEINILKDVVKRYMNGNVVCDAEHYAHYGNLKDYTYNIKRYVEGDRLGKIRAMELLILEDEDFSSERNRNTIDITKSGGGMLLDTGPHVFAFLGNCNCKVNYESIDAVAFKLQDPAIQDKKYRETSICIECSVTGRYCADNCAVDINLGKGFDKKNKRFTIHHDNGRVELDIAKKSMDVFRKDRLVEHRVFPQNPYSSLFEDIIPCIQRHTRPYNSIEKAFSNINDIFQVYERTKFAFDLN